MGVSLSLSVTNSVYLQDVLVNGLRNRPASAGLLDEAPCDGLSYNPMGVLGRLRQRLNANKVPKSSL